MKKLLSTVLCFALVIGVFAGFQAKPVKAWDSEVQGLSIYFPKVTYKSVKISCMRAPEAKSFTIYRADATKLYKKGKRKLEANKYKKIATVKAKSEYFKYTDKKVKKNRFYAYYVKGYVEENGKKILAYNSFDDDQHEYEGQYTGLDKPDVFIFYSDDAHVPTAKKIWFAVSFGWGVKPQKCTIYRKGPKDTKYKKVKLKVYKNVEKHLFLYKDTKVKANKYYKYKVRSYYKLGKKKYYSKKSDVFKVQAKYVKNWDDTGSDKE